MHTWFDAQLDQKILEGLYSRGQNVVSHDTPCTYNIVGSLNLARLRVARNWSELTIDLKSQYMKNKSYIDKKLQIK